MSKTDLIDDLIDLIISEYRGNIRSTYEEEQLRKIIKKHIPKENILTNEQ
jgi:hypothetical protein